MSLRTSAKMFVRWRAVGGQGSSQFTKRLPAGVLSTCHGVGNMNLARGIPYEPHTISQGADQNEQYVLLQEPPEVI